MKTLSIIIPMYNVAPYVERCIRSLEDQDIPHEDYELICINDGSPDNCQEIVENLQKEYPNVILINQKNQGVSLARNNGMDKAQGKYLLMIDPDDYVIANSFKSIIEKAEALNAQVSFLGYRFLNEDGSTRIDILNEKEAGIVHKGVDAYFLARGDGRTDPDRMVAVLFERNFINQHQLCYLPGVPYLEDGELIARIMCLAEKCIFNGKLFYLRTTRPGSATNSNLFHSEKATNGFIKAAVNLKDFKNRFPLQEEQKIFLNRPIVKLIILSIHSSVTKGSMKKINKTIKTLKNNGLQKCDIDGCDSTFKLYGKAYNFSVYWCVLLLLIWPMIIRINNLIVTKLFKK